MSKIREVSDRLDGFILGRISWPLTSWIDYRFHINPWKLAANLFQFACFQIIIVDSLPFTEEGHSLLWVGLLSGLIMVLVFWSDIKALNRISDFYERTRGTNSLPGEALQYLLPARRLLHVVFLFFFFPLGVGGLIGGIISAHSTYDIIRISMEFVGGMWWLTVTAALYCAALPPKQGKRKEKKAEAPMGAQYAGAPL